ncbi:MAG: cobyric acid synthase [Rubrobacter sp.]|nr:cobyric acid synthase [Rubrobacter sp.]
MRGSLLVCGTHSDAGKSVISAGLCRWLSREGVKVAPFKAQNMALNSYVALDGNGEGAEIGRAQAAQAAAAGVEPEAAMNPVLLKASASNRTQVIVMGKAHSDATAMSYQSMKRSLMPVVLEAFEGLRSRYDVVVCEGAGSPAEINLRKNDLANMGLARVANVPTVLVGDIDRGGLFASIYGTMMLLSEEDRSLVGGFIVNKFRGDSAVLQPGLEEMAHLTGRPFYGTIPFSPGLELDGEDSLALDKPRETKPPLSRDTIRVAVARLPRISNFTDFDPLSHEPGVEVRFVRSAADLLAADLAILPGTKATLEDLAWLRAVGMNRAVSERARRGLPTLGICGGYQMLGETITDESGVESEDREIAGLGLLPIETAFEEGKILARSSGKAPAFGGAEVSGYEIRHGRVRRASSEPLFLGDGFEEGCRSGNVLGTSWHGVLESDGFRRELLVMVARERGLRWVTGDESFAAAREARFERLGDLVADNLDRDALLRLIEGDAAHSRRQPNVSRQRTADSEGATREASSPSGNGVSVPAPPRFPASERKGSI